MSTYISSKNVSAFTNYPYFTDHQTTIIYIQKKQSPNIEAEHVLQSLEGIQNCKTNKNGMFNFALYFNFQRQIPMYFF